MAFNGRTLATAAEDGTCCVWDTKLRKLRTLQLPGAAANVPVGISMWQNHVLAAAGRGVYVWRCQDIEPSVALEGHAAECTVLCICREDPALPQRPPLIAAGGSDGRVLLWNARDLTASRSAGQPFHMATPTLHIEAHMAEVGGLCCVGSYLFSGGADGTLMRWTLPGGTTASNVDAGGQASVVEGGVPLGGHIDKVTAMASCDDDAAAAPAGLFTGGKDCVVRLWDVDSCELIAELIGHDDKISAITLTSRHVFSSDSASIRQWELGTFSCVHIFQAEETTGLAANPREIFVGSRNGTLGRFWGWAIPWSRGHHTGFPTWFRRLVCATVVSLARSNISRWEDLQDCLWSAAELALGQGEGTAGLCTWDHGQHEHVWLD